MNVLLMLVNISPGSVRNQGFCNWHDRMFKTMLYFYVRKKSIYDDKMEWENG